MIISHFYWFSFFVSVSKDSVQAEVVLESYHLIVAFYLG